MKAAYFTDSSMAPHGHLLTGASTNYLCATWRETRTADAQPSGQCAIDRSIRAGLLQLETEQLKACRRCCKHSVAAGRCRAKHKTDTRRVDQCILEGSAVTGCLTTHDSDPFRVVEVHDHLVGSGSELLHRVLGRIPAVEIKLAFGRPVIALRWKKSETVPSKCGCSCGTN